MKGFMSLVVAALGLLGFVDGFNTSNHPNDEVFYYSQWAVYGGRPPPDNTGSTMGGSYHGRYFYLDDFHAMASTYYAPGTTKIINFSFGGIDMDSCHIMTVDFWADLMVGVGVKLGSECGKKGAGYTNGTWSNSENRMVGGSDDCETGLACSLRNLKKKDSSWKIALSIGGWTMSTEFSRCVRDTNKRKALVSSLEWFVERFALDVVDIDWEYPSKAGCGGGVDDPCKMVISRKQTYSPQSKPAEHKCDEGAIYRLKNDLSAFPKILEYIDGPDTIGQAVSTAENCSEFHDPNWPGVPSGASGISKYWGRSISNRDWVNYVQLLHDFAAKSYKGRKLMVTSAVGMDPCLSTGKFGGTTCTAVPNYRVSPPHPAGQGTSLKAFCDVQSQTGGFVNFMTYDFYGNWSSPYHNAPLYDNPYLHGRGDYAYEMNVDRSSRNWLKKRHGGVQDDSKGCNPNQVNVGLALYGRTVTQSGRFGAFDSKAPTQKLGVGTYQAGVVSLWDVRHRFLNRAQGGDCESSGWGNEHCGKWELFRDVYAGCVPWLQKDLGNGLYHNISFDDDHSLGLKSKWARCMGFNGLLFWDAADDQDALGGQSSWKAWASVSKSDCPKILQPPTHCNGMPGKPVCFGNEGDSCTEASKPPIKPEPEIPEPEIPEPEIPEPEIPEPEIPEPEITEPETPEPEIPEPEIPEPEIPDLSSCSGFISCTDKCFTHLE